MLRFIAYITVFEVMFSQTGEHLKNSPLFVLSKIEKELIFKPEPLLEFNPKWVSDLKLILPCDKVNVPKRTMRLPNAPRRYRNGVHRGVDFFANWGTPVKAVADGIVVRSDHNFKEVPAEFRENMLDATTKAGYTPSDIFNSILLGKAVFLDHGFDLVPGFRTITIYAHLSHIEENIKAGQKVIGGQLLGKSGNTGMRESTLGSKSGSHLHWEMILQKNDQEIYLGKDITNPELYNMLYKIFN